MAYHEFHYRWEWQLQSNPETFWQLISNTNRFNRDTRVPSIEMLPGDTPLSNARHKIRLAPFGVPIELVEEPFEWIRPYRYGVVRRYTTGPVGEMRVRVELIPREDGGTHLIYEVWARPRNPLGLPAIPLQIGFLSRRHFDRVIREYDALAAAGKIPLYEPKDTRLPSNARARLAEGRERLLAQGGAPDLVNRLIDLIEHGDEITLSRMRPYALADYWGESRRSVVNLFLVATRVGLLDLQWDLLCPLCRGARKTSPTLGGIEPQVHCDTCNIDFEVNFERSVELTFRPNRAVRQIDVGEFCMAGPQVTPHIVVQQLLPAGEARTLTPSLEAGRYRLRTLNLRGGQFLRVEPDGQPEAVFQPTANGWQDDEPHIAPQPTLHFENATDAEQLFILERMAWSDQALTAAEVTIMQVFRDLFANEALRPGEQISVGSLTILFTDLRGSTSLYREIGDAVAFGLVMNHFDILRDAIAAEDGAIVKTIGDAVMAVFHQPASAIKAILRVQKRLTAPVSGKRILELKAGIHYGPCIAVTLNERLDYFGSTVNIAARLESQSSGHDIIISDEVYNAPEVQELLRRGGNVAVERFETPLKGFGDERFALWRVALPDVATKPRLSMSR